MSSAPHPASPAEQSRPFPWLASWFTDPRYRFDLLTGIGLVLLFAAAAAGSDETYLIPAMLGLPWFIRRRYPRICLTAAVIAAALHLIVLDLPSFAIVVIPMYVYTFARWTSASRLRRTAALVALAGSFLGPARWLLLDDEGLRAIPGALITMLACAGVIAVAYVVGSRRREQVERAAQAVAARVDRARLIAAEQEQRARVAAIDERTRIARELHDIVAHSLSVIVVQAEGGRALATKQPQKAPEVLATIADTSREALEEMRQMVGLLRSGGPIGDPATAPPGAPESYLPTPGLADLDELVAKIGDRVTLTRYGAEPVVSQPIALTVYRIVQESITNVLKHAGPGARAAVGVTYAENGIGIRVVDNGRGPAGDAGPSRSPGHGLRGMRERVALHNGTLDAGPLPTGGFQVLAWLPFPTSPNPYQSRRS